MVQWSIIPNSHPTELVPLLGPMLSERGARDGGDPFVGPSPQGFLGISYNGLGRFWLTSKGDKDTVVLTEHLMEASPVIVLNFSSCEDQTSEA